MNLTTNQILHYNNDGPEYRILWIDPENHYGYRIRLDSHCCVPEKFDTEAVARSVESGECTLKDRPDGPYTAPENADQKAAEKRDRRWNLIRNAVSSEPEIYEPKNRAQILKETEQKTGVSRTNLYRLLGKYWRMGKVPNALLGNYRETGRCRDYTKGEYKNLGRPRTPGACGKDLTPEDLRNFSDIIRRYYLKEQKCSFTSAYERLIQEHYTTEILSDCGEKTLKILPHDQIPSITQFKYWYKKNRDIVEETKKREGDTKFNLLHRAITGKTETFLSGPGSAYQIDATIADVFLVSSTDRSKIIGRPTMYFVMDAYSRMVTGMNITLEAPSWEAASMALQNATENKAQFCRKYQIEIQEEEWPCMHLPEAILADRGEMESHAADCLATELGIRIENTPPYRGDLKGVIEQHFNLINLEMTDLIPGKVKKDFGERSARDYRLDAVLDIRQFTRIIIRCVLFYNNLHYMKEYGKTPKMRELQIRPIPRDLWNYGMKYCIGALRTMPKDQVHKALLPKGTASITEKGILFHGMYYSCNPASEERWFEAARIEGRKKVPALYDPRDINVLYLESENREIECTLLEHQRAYANQTSAEQKCDAVNDHAESKTCEVRELEGKANLNSFIDQEIKEAETKAPSHKGVSKAERIRQISENRKKETEQSKNVSGSKGFTAKSDPGVTDEASMNPIERMLYEKVYGKQTGKG